VNVSVAEYDPVLTAGLFTSAKLVCTVFGFTELHDPPPPVQALAPTVTRLVCEVVEAVCVPEHAEPSVAELQVYVSCPPAIDGPPTGLKSAVALTVREPLPVEAVVRAR
jgi:hypothetical protein